MTIKYLLCFAIVALSLKNVRADTKEEQKTAVLQKLIPLFHECGADIEDEEKTLKKAKEFLETVDTCVLACVFKKIEFINDKGMFVPENAVKKAKEFLSDEEELESATATFKKCEEVNSEDVNDGDAGCDRAELLVQCLSEAKS